MKKYKETELSKIIEPTELIGKPRYLISSLCAIIILQ